GLYDDHFAPKPAYYALLDVLEEYYDGPACDFLPATRYAKVGGGETTVQTNFFNEASGVVTLSELNSFALYFFNTPYPGHYSLDLQIEHDQPSPITLQATVDGGHAEAITLNPNAPDGSTETITFYAEPIQLERGARVVQVKLTDEAYSCGGTYSDACDGNGILRGIRLRRVGD
ncbi:MAG TPA: hypothetical protein VLC09_00375, partial [Polyangiaceae bacterium]|nr:hypothetical protein [Polyangiaceae bacterium]